MTIDTDVERQSVWIVWQVAMRMAIKVIEDNMVAKMLQPAAHQGSLCPPRKKSSVDLFRKEKKTPIIPIAITGGVILLAVIAFLAFGVIVDSLVLIFYV